MDRDWMQLIDRRAALREQFPTLSQVRNERPGCAADVSRQAFYRAENRRSVQSAAEARWEASVAANTARMGRNKQRAANAAYKARERGNEEVA